MDNRLGFLRRAGAVFICLCVLLCLAMPCFAEGEGVGVTLRVAYYPLAGFFEYDENGNEVGYGVDTLNMLSRYTGIKFTYVQAESWEATKYMLLDGVADVRMPGTKPSVPSTTLSYTQHSIIDTYEAVLTLKTRSDLFYEDYEQFKALKFAATTSYLDSLDDSTFASYNITADNLIFYDEYNDCRAALEAGEVDAVITNIMDMDSEMKQLARFYTSSNYICMTLDNPYIDVINDALSQIKLNAPTFFADEYQKWFPERVAMPFTKSETQYLADSNGLSFVFNDNYGYLSRLENGEHVGFYPSLAQLVCEKLGQRCIEAQDRSGESGAVILPYFVYDYVWAEDKGVAITQPYSSMSYYEMTRKSGTIDPSACRVAAVEANYVTQKYILGRYDASQLKYYDSYAECIDAVANGYADITYANSNVAEYYMSMYRYSNLSATLTDFSHQICFGVRGDDTGVLVSLLNKTVGQLTDDEVKAVLMQNTSQKVDQNLFMEWVYQNPVAFVSIVGMLLIVAASLVFLIVFNTRMRRKNSALLVATNAKQEFLSRMSHDMRTPMNAIIGFSSFGMDSRSLAEAQSYHGKIYKSGEYLLQLINDTLDLSKLESGKYELNPEPYLNTDFVDSLNNILEPRAREKCVTLEIKYNQTPSWVYLDKLRTQQIFVNLLNNAIKFTPAGGLVALHITSEDEGEDGRALTFKVIDTGIGMSPQFVSEHLFKPFEQEHQTENSGGTGLGLSIVKNLVETMGGTITCESTLGKGTTFTVVLHVKNAPTQKAEPTREKAQLSQLEGKRVLMCEDHPLNREITCRQLQNVGITTDTANDGEQGVAKFNEMPAGTYFAVLMDIRMPVLDGYEATRRIRTLDKADAKTVPIIALSANAYAEDVAACIAAGMNAHVPKPVNPQKLYEELLRFI